MALWCRLVGVCTAVVPQLFLACVHQVRCLIHLVFLRGGHSVFGLLGLCRARRLYGLFDSRFVGLCVLTDVLDGWCLWCYIFYSCVLHIAWLLLVWFVMGLFWGLHGGIGTCGERLSLPQFQPWEKRAWWWSRFKEPPRWTLFLFEAGERPYEKKLTISISYGLLSPDKTYLVSNVRLGHVALQTTIVDARHSKTNHPGFYHHSSMRTLP